MPMCYCSICGSIYHQLKKDAGLWQDKSDSGGFTPFEKFLYYNTEDEYKMYDFVTEKYLCSHFRMKDKEKQGFPRGIRDGEHVTKGTDGVDTTYAVFCNGHLKEVKNAIEKKSLVCYTEGEKDTKCLWNNDCISFTCGGTNTFKKELLPYLKGGRFAVFGDNDRTGIADAERITALLNTVGTATMIIPPEVPEKGDISDYMKKHTKEDLQTLIKDALNKSTVKESVRHVENRKINLVDKLIELDAAKNYATNDKGSAELFSTVFKDVSRYNPTQKDWMYYNGIKWVADTEGMRAKRNAKELADALLSYAVSNPELDEKQRESYLKYASRLMNYRDRNTMINDAKDLNYFENEELDKEDFLLNCKNCVLDLSGNKPTILKHNADLLLSKVCNTSYEPAAVQGSTEEYENDSDKIGRFISECLVKSDKNVSAKTVYETYSKWCSASGCGIENKGNFFTELKVKGIFATSGTVNGRTVRNVVKGYELAEDDFVAVDDDTLLPFD